MPNTPPTHDGSLADAWRIARDQRTPVFLPTRFFTDDRGWSLMNQMRGVLSEQGQINYSCQYPGVVKAWHRHHKQTDFWLCLNGHIKIGVHREADDDHEAQSWALVTGEKRPGVMVIPPPLWHGAATVGPTPAGLLYYVTHAYNPDQPDEDRRAYDSIAGFNWTVEHK